MKSCNICQKLLNRKYKYGGELLPLGVIVADLQENAPNQRCVDRYLQGLFLKQGDGQ